MENGIIGALIGGLVGLIPTAAAAWVLIRKSRAETAKVEAETKKAERGDVLEEWREIAAQQALRIDACEAKCKELHGLNDKLRHDYQDEIKAVRRECETELKAVYAELAAIRRQIVERETERIHQRGEIAGLKETSKESPKDAKVVAYTEADKVPTNVAKEVKSIIEKSGVVTTVGEEITDHAKKITDRQTD